MPRLYLTPAELQELPLGISPQVQSILSQLGAGVLDKMLFRASQRCDRYCQKRLQAPGQTTLSANASASATSISLASTLTFDDLAEQAVVLNPGGGNQETVLIQPGGVTVTSSMSPYPGTLALASGLQFGHSSGEAVQGVYMEVSEAGSSSTSDPYTESLQTQAMQLALAHLPPARTALTRVVFTKSYPIIKLYNLEHAFSFVNQFNPVDMSVESIVPTEGWIRFNVGLVILREGLMRMTYTAGYQVIPDDIKMATSLYLAEQLVQWVNPFGVNHQSMGKRSLSWDTAKGSTVVKEAEDILRRYKRTI